MPGADVVDVPIERIRTAPEKLQYKIGYGREGAGLALTKSQRFNRQLSGVVTLMHDPDNPGDYLIVNGHQRLDLARRTDEATMRSQVLPPGTTFEQARAIGARVNIAEGRGTPIDAAKYMRDSGTTPEQLATEGIDLSESMASDAAALSHLSDPIFRDVTLGRFTPSKAVVIGRELADNRPAQEAIYRSVRELEDKGQSVPAPKLAEMIRLASGGNITEIQTDLFGARALEKSLVPQKADILSHVRERLGRDKRLFGTVARERQRLATGGTQVDVTTATGISQGAAIRQDLLDRTAYRGGTEVSTILTDYAQKLATSPKGARAGVLQDAYQNIYDALDRDFQAAFRSQAPAGIRPEAGPGQSLLGGGFEQPRPTTTAPELEAPPTAAELEAAGQSAMFGPRATTLGGTFVPGGQQFAEQTIAPAVENARSYLKSVGQTARAWFAPKAVSPEARVSGEVLTRSTSRAREAMRQRRLYLQQSERLAASWSPAEQIDFLRTADRRVAQDDPVKQEIAINLYKILDDKRDQIRALGTKALSHYFTDYFPRQWTNPEHVAKGIPLTAAEEAAVSGTAPMGRTLEGPKRFLKKRILASFDEGIQRGLTPKYSNPVELVRRTADDMDRYIAGQTLLADLKERGYLKFARNRRDIPAGWAEIDDRITKRYRPVTEGREELDEPTAFVPSGQYVAPESVARIVNNDTRPGLSGSAPFRGFREASGVANMIQLGVSAFHLATTTVTASASDVARAFELAGQGRPLKAGAAFLRGLTPGASLARDVAEGGKLFKFADQPEFRVAHPELKRFFDAYIDSGANFERSLPFRSRLYESTVKHLRSGDVIGAALRAPLAAVEKMASPLFDYVIPRAKAGAFMDLARDFMERNPAATDGEALAAFNKITDSIDNRFGMVAYDRWNLDRRVRDSLFVMFRAPGWTLGNIREFGGGITTGLAESLRSGRIDHRTAFTLALPLAAGWYTALYQYGKTGQWPDIETPLSHGDLMGALRNLLTANTGRLNTDGTPEKVVIPGLHKDLASFAFRVGAPLARGDIVGGIQGVGQFLGAKTNPMVAIARNIYANKDFYGHEIVDRSAPAETQVAQLAKHAVREIAPFTTSNLAERLARETGTKPEGIGETVAAARAHPGVAAESFMGVMPALKTATPLEDFLHSRLPAMPPMTAAHADQQEALRKLQSDIRNRRSPDVYHDLHSGRLSERQIVEALRRGHQNSLDGLMQRASLEDLARGARLASPEQLPALARTMQAKLASAWKAKTITPDDARRYFTILRQLQGQAGKLPPPKQLGPGASAEPNRPAEQRREAAEGLGKTLARGRTPDITDNLMHERLTTTDIHRLLRVPFPIIPPLPSRVG